jgi:hypothetical protein
MVSQLKALKRIAQLAAHLVDKAGDALFAIGHRITEASPYHRQRRGASAS